MEIVNISSYCSNMKKGMEDKLFFLDRLPSEGVLFVDFGCADGSLLHALTELRPGCHYIGYDVSKEMIGLAKTSHNWNPKSDVILTTDWNDVAEKMKNCPVYRTVLILSSVIHEVYSYSTGIRDIIDFWNKVENSGFDYVIIRDMMVTKDLEKSTDLVDRWNNLMRDCCLQRKYGKLKNSFEEIWGPINNDKQLFHFLLKYRWTINWDREIHENYFPITIDELLKLMCEFFNIEYFERFRVPFLDQCWKDDFSFQDIGDSFTHIKAIFKKKFC